MLAIWPCEEPCDFCVARIDGTDIYIVRAQQKSQIKGSEKKYIYACSSVFQSEKGWKLCAKISVLSWHVGESSTKCLCATKRNWGTVLYHYSICAHIAHVQKIGREWPGNAVLIWHDQKMLSVKKKKANTMCHLNLKPRLWIIINIMKRNFFN